MPTENLPERTFIVLSLKHTHRRHRAITLWRANDSGYCWPLERAGVYPESLVLERLGYYNSGCSNIAVPTDLVKRLVGDIEYDTKEFGICLPNKANTWKQLLSAVIRKPVYPSRPEYRGVRYAKEAA
ncbi:hypothetical protein FJD38_17610 [Pseudomonas saxonica]|uniref:Uncharacterized protein n=1 Tax=Pseudomonas saxonica TaxID=2600598 RepID=A0ABY3GHF6_9PSED|nr:hypothetical protein [Pseudomonas saxonica]TWR87842.1 hypothetical protein FJD38_17610 [Pseudomonas saxonica]